MWLDVYQADFFNRPCHNYCTGICISVNDIYFWASNRIYESPIRYLPSFCNLPWLSLLILVIIKWVFGLIHSRVFSVTHSKSLRDLSIYVSSLDKCWLMIFGTISQLHENTFAECKILYNSRIKKRSKSVIDLGYMQNIR